MPAPKPRQVKIALFLGLLVTLLGFSEFCAGEDLKQLFSLAQREDRDYASEAKMYLAAQQKIPEAVSAFLPKLSLDARGSKNSFEEQGFPRQKYQANGFGLTLSQPLFRWADWSNYSESRIEVASAAVRLQQAESELIQRVCVAYFSALESVSQLELAQIHAKNINTQKVITENNLAHGTATIVDLDEAEAAYEISKSEELDARNSLVMSLANLSIIVSRVPEHLTPLRSEAALPTLDPDDIGQWISLASDNSYDVQLQKLGQQTAHLETQKARAAFLPTVALVAHANQGNGPYIAGQTSNISGQPGRSSDIGLVLTIPLFDGVATVAQTKEKAILEDKAGIDLDKARRTSELRARKAFLDFKAQVAKINSLLSARQAAQISLTANRKGYDVGIRINADVLNAEEKVYAAERDLTTSKYQVLIAEVDLKAAVAILSEDDVSRLNDLLIQ